MRIKKPSLYVNRFTGDIKQLKKSDAIKLSEDWSRIDFTKNEEGKPVMRMQLNGATVDILENESEEAETNGNDNAK